MSTHKQPDLLTSGLASLLTIGKKDSSSWQSKDLEAMLRHQFTLKLADELGVRLSPGDPVTFHELLHAEKPPLGLLRAVKDYCKRSGSTSDLPQEIGAVLYAVVIALARRHYSEHLSTLSDQKIAEHVRWVRKRDWVDEATRSLLANEGSQPG